MLKVVGASWIQIRISTWIILVVIGLGIIAIILGEIGRSNEDGMYSATAYWSPESGFTFTFWGQGNDLQKIHKGAARAYFKPQTNTTGWSLIEIETQAEYPDWVQAFAAGMLEGSLSWQMIHWHWQNTVQNTCTERELFCAKVKDYLEENYNYIREMAQNLDHKPYWHQINLFYLQLDGLENGFKLGVKRSRQDIEDLTPIDFIWMNAASDLVDLEFVFDRVNSLKKNHKTKHAPHDKTREWRFEKHTSYHVDDNDDTRTQEYEQILKRFSRLSTAFIKLVADGEDLYVAHNSADDYNTMLKMLKRYDFQYHQTGDHDSSLVSGTSISFSSYPGAVHSMDDFYVINNEGDAQHFVVVGSAITNFNNDLWDFVQPTGQVLIGPRVMTSNRLALDGEVWCQTLTNLNSGTANKQWMFINFGQFEMVQQKLQSSILKLENVTGLLWVAELIPGYYEFAQQTHVLTSTSYWASYGLPFYERIQNLSHINLMEEKYGDEYSYENFSLAQIFERDEDNVTDIASLIKLMRSNGYKHDPFSYGDPLNAIASRGDVPATDHISLPIGVTDLKVYSSKLFCNTTEVPEDIPSHPHFPPTRQNLFLVVSGPTYNNATTALNNRFELPPFSWYDSVYENVSHVGHPDIWKFEPLYLKWIWS